MKKAESKAESMIEDGNLEYVDSVIKQLKLKPEALGLLRLVADMMDHIARDENYYMIIGTTKSFNAYSCTIKGNDAPDPIYASNLEELNIKANKLI